MSGIGKISEDLTGLTFGRLTVIQRAENIRGRTAWLCRCECGNMKTVLTKYLKNGSVQSCGCLRKEVQAEKAKNIAGFRFGKLTALRPSDKRDANGSVIWECRCDCGNTAYISIARLKSGNNISCGCAYEETHKKTAINTCQKKRRKDNTSGYRGVNKTKDGRYRVSIGFKGKRYYIGLYDNYQDAVKKRLEAEKLIHDGYIQAKEHWDHKEPLIFEVYKKDNRIFISSNDPAADGLYVSADINEKKTEYENYYQRQNMRRPLSRKNVHL